VRKSEAAMLLGAVLLPVVLFVTTYVLRVIREGAITSGVYHHNLLYFVQTAVFSYSYRDYLYGIELLHYPFLFLFSYDFILLGAVLVLVTCLLMALLLLRLGLDTRVVLLSVALFGIAGFVQQSAHFFVPLLAAIAYFILVWLLLLSSLRAVRILGVLLFTLIIFFGLPLTIAFVLGTFLLHKHLRQPVYQMYFLSLLLLCGSVLLLTLVSTIPVAFPVIEHNFSFVEFGNPAGFSLVLLLMSAMASLVIWKREYKLPYIAGIVSILLAFWHPVFFLFVGVLCSLCLSVFVFGLRKQKWVVEPAKLVAAVGIGCSLVLAVFIAHTVIMDAYPGTDEMQAISFIANNVPNDARLLTSTQFGSLTESLTLRHATFASFLVADGAHLYRIQSLHEAVAALDLHQVDYVVIDDIVRVDYLDGREQGLARLVRDQDFFSLVFEQGSISIWQFIPAHDQQ